MKKKKTPFITKDEFVECVNTLKEQEKKDTEFADFMEKYLDGRCVPTLSDHATKAAMKLLALAFEDRSKETWVEWFAYECEFGARPMSVYVNDKEYVISSAEEMYDFMTMYMNL